MKELPVLEKAAPVAEQQPPPAEVPRRSETEMRAASATTKQLLYTGLSAEGEGRKAYLVQRRIKNPEDKFQFPLTSALEVGWKIREVGKKGEGKPAQFGRSRIVQDTFFRTNGCF